MEPWLVSTLCVVLMMLLVFFGIYVAYGLILSGAIGILLIGGTQMLKAQIGIVGYGAAANYGYVVIPMFILMGQFAAEANLGQDAFHAARLWIGHLRGGLAIATIAGCAAFGAASGSTAATWEGRE